MPAEQVLDATQSELERKEKEVIERFDQARAHGASERTAIIVAAWAWLETHPGGTIVRATEEVRHFLSKHGRPVAH